MAIAPKSTGFDEVHEALDRLNSEVRSADQLMQGIALLLSEKLPKYNWVGFYMLEPGANPPMLALGHYQGAPTPHTRISLDRDYAAQPPLPDKLCWWTTFSGDPRYLACSLETKSEIVVPVFYARCRRRRARY